eukprot:TRINITY_DN10742_c0_g1_i1.p1 TRINITY_DN10742_c0_g1~~TRINITY_DN10742_c0_g1_i1.p1  ORF type:complete len:906 (-),score=154.01 TRINITY_DN10742_c0_g1_i1:338-3055(-)
MSSHRAEKRRAAQLVLQAKLEAAYTRIRELEVQNLAPCELDSVGQEVRAGLSMAEPALTRLVAAGQNPSEKTPAVPGDLRAARNYGLHCNLGCGISQLPRNAAEARRWGRGGRSRCSHGKAASSTGADSDPGPWLNMSSDGSSEADDSEREAAQSALFNERFREAMRLANNSGSEMLMFADIRRLHMSSENLRVTLSSRVDSLQQSIDNISAFLKACAYMPMDREAFTTLQSMGKPSGCAFDNGREVGTVATPRDPRVPDLEASDRPFSEFAMSSSAPEFIPRGHAFPGPQLPLATEGPLGASVEKGTASGCEECIPTVPQVGAEDSFDACEKSDSCSDPESHHPTGACAAFGGDGLEENWYDEYALRGPSFSQGPDSVASEDSFSTQRSVGESELRCDGSALPDFDDAGVSDSAVKGDDACVKGLISGVSMSNAHPSDSQHGHPSQEALIDDDGSQHDAGDFLAHSDAKDCLTALEAFAFFAKKDSAIAQFKVASTGALAQVPLSCDDCSAGASVHPLGGGALQQSCIMGNAGLHDGDHDEEPNPDPLHEARTEGPLERFDGPSVGLACDGSGSGADDNPVVEMTEFNNACYKGQPVAAVHGSYYRDAIRTRMPARTCERSYDLPMDNTPQDACAMAGSCSPPNITGNLVVDDSFIGQAMHKRSDMMESKPRTQAGQILESPCLHPVHHFVSSSSSSGMSEARLPNNMRHETKPHPKQLHVTTEIAGTRVSMLNDPACTTADQADGSELNRPGATCDLGSLSSDWRKLACSGCVAFNCSLHALPRFKELNAHLPTLAAAHRRQALEALITSLNATAINSPVRKVLLKVLILAHLSKPETVEHRFLEELIGDIISTAATSNTVLPALRRCVNILMSLLPACELLRHEGIATILAKPKRNRRKRPQ